MYGPGCETYTSLTTILEILKKNQKCDMHFTGHPHTSVTSKTHQKFSGNQQVKAFLH